MFEVPQTHVIYKFLRVAGEGYTSFFRVYIQQFGTSAEVLNEGSEHIGSNFPLVLCILLIKKRMYYLDGLKGEFVGFDDAFVRNSSQTDDISYEYERTYHDDISFSQQDDIRRCRSRLEHRLRIFQ